MKSSIRRMLAPAAAAALAAGLLTGCGSEEPAEFDTAAQQQGTNEPEDKPEEDGDEDGAEEQSEDSGDADADGAADSSASTGQLSVEDATQTITYDMPDADSRDEATVTVGLHSLRVDGEVMLLELSFTPEFRGDGSYNIYQMVGHQLMEPVLNDRDNLKQYTVLRTSRSFSDLWATEASGGQLSVASGQTLAYWAYFAAPEDDIDSIALSVLSGLVEFDDVAIER